MIESWLIAFWILLLGMGWFTRCCGGIIPGEPCTYCSGTTPITVTLIFDGFNTGGSACPCDRLNGTYVLTQWSSFCIWTISKEFVSCTSPSSSGICGQQQTSNNSRAVRPRMKLGGRLRSSSSNKHLHTIGNRGTLNGTLAEQVTSIAQ